MTTFTFVDVEVTTALSEVSYINQQTLYTVPSGKIAKIKFDSSHITSTASGGKFAEHSFICFSQGTNVKRKHIVGYTRSSNTGVSSLHYYNPKDWTFYPAYSGAQSDERIYHPMNVQPTSWNPQNTIDTTMSNSIAGYHKYEERNLDYGSRVYSPETFFMKAGEILKYSDGLYYETPSGTRYTNMRLAVWLEDV
jgi:hypothetical protein